MDLIFNSPYIIRVLISLLVILIANKLSKQLSFSILIGILMLALWSRHSFSAIFLISKERFLSENNLFLIIVVMQVIGLSNQMSLTGTMKKLVTAVRSRVSQRTSMALLPAVIGLLPMPGGAIFSAPLVDDCDPSKNVYSLLKTKINYWFRHIWEYWWPLYPGVLLAIDITGLPIITFILLQLPMSLLAIASGYIFLLRKVKNADKKQNRKSKTPIKHLIILISPIIIIIGCYTIIQIFFSKISGINKYLPMIIGICCAQIVLQIQHPLNFSKWKKIIFSKKTISITLIVILVRIYGAFIEARLPDGLLLMTYVRKELISIGIPLLFIIILLPFISGLTTGLSVGFVGASFPIVMNLIGNSPALKEILATTVLAYAAGYMGLMLSPVHVCLIVTNEYFKTSLTSSIIGLLKPALAVLACAILIYLLIL